MSNMQTVVPDNTAVRTTLWRALDVELDSPPHVFDDEVGLKLVAPDDGWRNRPDMSSITRPFWASIMIRARLIEDLVTEQATRGIRSSSFSARDRAPSHSESRNLRWA